jgi:hypothetical protein
MPAIRREDGGPAPRRILSLACGIYPLRLRKLDAHTLSVRSEAGLLQPLGLWRSQAEPRVPAISQVYALQVLNQFPRGGRPFSSGDRLTLEEVEILVAEITDDGFPREVHFRFRLPLGDGGLRFAAWENGRFVPFSMPGAGERRDLLPFAP